MPPLLFSAILYLRSSMIKSFLLIAATWITLASSAQAPLPDSLQQLIQRATSDTAKAAALFELGDYWSISDTSKAISYIRRGMQLAKNDPFYQGLGHFYLGRAYFDNDHSKAEAEFRQANTLLAQFHTSEAYIYASRSWANIANIAQRGSNEKAYVDILLQKAIPLAAKGNDSIRVAVYFMNVALPFMDFKDYDKAIYYFAKSDGIFKRHNAGDLRRADIYINMAKTYILSGHLPQAKESLAAAQTLLQRDTAAVYSPGFYGIKGMYHLHAKEWELAEKSVDTGLALARKSGSRPDVKQLLYQQALLFNQQNDFKSVLKILQQLYQGAYLTTDTDKKQLLHDLAATEANLGNMQGAYNWLLQYSAFSDSLNEQKMRVEIAGLEAKYNLSKKEQQLLIVKNNAKRQRLIAAGSIIGLFIAVLFFIYLYRSRRSKAEQELKSLKQQQQIALTQALLQGEERERTRLARDLHDGLGGMLAGVKINLSNVLHETTSAELDRVIGQLDDSVTELRRIARNMMPEALLRSGLETALSDLCQSLSNEHRQVASSFMNIAKTIPRQTQIIIYRIIQELLANVARHSGATEVFVQCSQNGNIFYITVEDNGKGIDRSKHPGNKGMGLENIRSRVDFLKGKIDISSEPGKGTITNIEITVDGEE